MMNVKRLILTSSAATAIVVGAVFWPGGEPEQAAPSRLVRDRLLVLITGTTRGNLEPCNCPGQPRGGLSRRAALLDRLAADYEHSVRVDVGDLGPLERDAILDRYMVRGYAALPYDAVALGDLDVEIAPLLATQAQKKPLPLVCANVRVRAFGDQPTICPPHRLIERSGKRVLLIGILGATAVQFLPAQAAAGIEMRDPAEAVAAAIAAVSPRPDAVIVLAHLDPGERSAVLASLPPVDLVVLATENEQPAEVQRIGGRPAVFAPPFGYEVLAVELSPDGQPISVRSHPVEAPAGRHSQLWELYQAYSYDAAKAVSNLPARAAGVRFVAAATCGSCHPKQLEFWKDHAHGKAWATIVREQRTNDPACMRCHTTGFGLVGGFRTPDETPSLTNVGCQSCHLVDVAACGQGMKPPRVDPQGCLTCHTDANSPQFTPEEYLPKATCPGMGSFEEKAD